MGRHHHHSPGRQLAPQVESCGLILLITEFILQQLDSWDYIKTLILFNCVSFGMLLGDWTQCIIKDINIFERLYLGNEGDICNAVMLWVMPQCNKLSPLPLVWSVVLIYLPPNASVPVKKSTLWDEQQSHFYKLQLQSNTRNADLWSLACD